jgi:hypothetical protein
MDIERYTQLRDLSRRIMSELTKTIPREAYEEIGKALGIVHKNTFVLDTMDVSCVLMDACLFDWIREGKNLVQRYVEVHPPDFGTDEHLLLQAFCRAEYRLLQPKAVSAGAVTHCLDVLAGKSIQLVDIGISQSTAHGFQGLLATRTAPLERWWMTTGAGLPIGDKKTGERVVETIVRGNLLEDTSSTGQHKLAIAVIHACLDAGAAEHVRYLGGEEEEEKFGSPRLTTELRSPRRHIDRNDLCPCGSGKRYRRCCMRRQPAPP